MAHYCGVFGLDLAEITCQSNSEGGIVIYISFEFTVKIALCFVSFRARNTRKVLQKAADKNRRASVNYPLCALKCLPHPAEMEKQ